MYIVAIAADRTITFEHIHVDGSMHHFSLAPAALVPARNPDGSPDRTLLLTPAMTCTDAGCTSGPGGTPLVAQSFFPLTGGATAQRVHALARIAQSLAADAVVAAGQVNQLARAAGGVGRLSGTPADQLAVGAPPVVPIGPTASH